jgi:hypothetical protein
MDRCKKDNGRSSFVVDQRHLDTQGRLRTRYVCAAELRPSLGPPNEIENHSKECWNAAKVQEHVAIAETACTLQFKIVRRSSFRLFQYLLEGEIACECVHF